MAPTTPKMSKHTWGQKVIASFDADEDLGAFLASILDDYRAALKNGTLGRFKGAPVLDVQDLVRQSMMPDSRDIELLPMGGLDDEDDEDEGYEWPQVKAEQASVLPVRTVGWRIKMEDQILSQMDNLTSGVDEKTEMPQKKKRARRTGAQNLTPKRPKVSHYFDTKIEDANGEPSTPPLRTRAKSRPPAGTSCLPFPPLTAPHFGLIQEELSHDPFWLLVAVTFLIKTRGQVAIPAFRVVMERFPTPEALADPANEEELLVMIQHLGLGRKRVDALQRYGRLWIEKPPAKGVRYRVKGYAEREHGPPGRGVGYLTKEDDDELVPPTTPSPVGIHGRGNEDSGIESEPLDSDDVNHLIAPSDMDAWEIGHFTQGRYVIDSWRIFCRDELLGRSRDWSGHCGSGSSSSSSSSSGDDFQPEWMRVQPLDKELRACLRWAWMREGWEWDPATGERAVLSREMEAAVNEGRVEWDESGSLVVRRGPTMVEEECEKGALC